MTGEVLLLVDDNPLNLKLVDYLLTVKGYVVITATSAEETLDLLKKVTVNLILLDLQLPGMDGLALTKILKADTKYQKIPIIAITAYAMKGDKERALEAGCDGYISKPIDTRKLPEMVAEYLRLAKEK